MAYIVKNAKEDLGIMKKQFSLKYLDYNTTNIIAVIAKKNNRLSTGNQKRKIKSSLGYTVKTVAKDTGIMSKPGWLEYSDSNTVYTIAQIVKKILHLNTVNEILNKFINLNIIQRLIKLFW